MGYDELTYSAADPTINRNFCTQNIDSVGGNTIQLSYIDPESYRDYAINPTTICGELKSYTLSNEILQRMLH